MSWECAGGCICGDNAPAWRRDPERKKPVIGDSGWEPERSTYPEKPTGVWARFIGWITGAKYDG